MSVEESVREIVAMERFVGDEAHSLLPVVTNEYKKLSKRAIKWTNYEGLLPWPNLLLWPH